MKRHDETSKRELEKKIQRIREKVGLWLGILLTIGIGVERMNSYAKALEEGPSAPPAAALVEDEVPAADSEALAVAVETAQGEGLEGVSQESAPVAGASADGELRFELGGQNEVGAPVEPRTIRNEELKPLGAVNPKDFESIKTRKQACAAFEGKLIAFYDQTALIERCRLRLIEDALLLNIVRKSNPDEIRDVPASVYRLFEHGEPIREADLAGLEAALGLNRDVLNCEALNGQYVTVSGENFFYIEGCKKRRFERYAGLVEHNRKRQTILTITPALLTMLPDGKPMPESGLDVADVWIEIDGDASWQRASRIDATKTEKEDSPERLREIAAEIKRSVDTGALCREINGLVVSFYSDLYFAEKCKLRPITDRTLELQVRLSGKLKVRDLSAHEKRALSMGDGISAQDVVKRLDTR